MAQLFCKQAEHTLQAAGTCVFQGVSSHPKEALTSAQTALLHNEATTKSRGHEERPVPGGEAGKNVGYLCMGQGMREFARRMRGE